MKKVINFCKSYLAEVLFAVAVLLCIGVIMYSMFCLSQNAATAITIIAVIVLAVLGFYFQKLEKTVSQPSGVFTVVYGVGFFLLVLVWVIGKIIICPLTMKLLIYLLLIAFSIVFVALFGYMIIVADQTQEPSENVDVCDN